VLPGAQIAVREPDRPPDDEREQLQKELRQVEEGAQALIPTPQGTPGGGVWVRWHQVSDFYASTPASRHFALDPITGQVRFGDGRRGKIPPVGRDNIKAVVYRTHNGSQGNAASGTITALRNPSGDLADIQSVTNYDAAAGGSNEETVEQVKRRGPQSLKHRQRAVALEDFEWLALEATGEVAQARCLPTRNRQGLPEPGWATVVITPDSSESRPMPSPVLLRRVQAYLQDRALANLKEIRHIHVRGPDYVEASVLARVVPSEPEKADDVELALLQALETFLHPLRGGPEQTGWELGRDIYVSEVYAEMEAVSGVDHVAGLRLLASIQQYRLHLQREDQRPYRQVPFDLPVDSHVSSFDERIKLLLAEALDSAEGESGELRCLAVYGFKVGDRVAIVKSNNSILKDNLTIASLTGDEVTFDQPFEQPGEWADRDAVMSSDGRLRLPLQASGVIVDSDGKVIAVRVRGFQARDRDLCVVVGTHRDPALEFLPIAEVTACEDRIYVPEGHLITSGTHDIEMILE
jgi:hypothetical protein